MDQGLHPFRLIGRAEVAGILGVSIPTIDKLTVSGKIPPPIKIGRSVRWHPEQIIDFINKKVKSVGAAPADQPQAPAAEIEAQAPAEQAPAGQGQEEMPSTFI